MRDIIVAEGIELIDGTATYWGDGVFVVLQKDESGRPQNVVLQKADLERMLAES